MKLASSLALPKALLNMVFQELLREKVIKMLHSEDEKMTRALRPLKNFVHMEIKTHQI
jgi:hypothetical protein